MIFVWWSTRNLESPIHSQQNLAWCQECDLFPTTTSLDIRTNSSTGEIGSQKNPVVEELDRMVRMPLHRSRPRWKRWEGPNKYINLRYGWKYERSSEKLSSLGKVTTYMSLNKNNVYCVMPRSSKPPDTCKWGGPKWQGILQLLQIMLRNTLCEPH